ncbi:universal stress protein [Kineosporia sp. R_H_3]|uniref:universal stress protein n=1 Tax=Kineosporia sp. R_H_3 TaxID=1961848 RepID=UPI000B4BCA4C|nr:universal stress protein [Kineosporia sp. R_H_3]
MRYVVGYVPNQHGVDAVTLAATLAAAGTATLDIVVVTPVETVTFDMYSPDHAYFSQVEKQGKEWLDAAMTHVPDGVTATARLVHGESVTEGLIHAATDPAAGDEAGLVVIGAAQRGLLGRFTVGSVAGALLHSSPVPVALAPAGYEGHPAITRITCATGTREGADALVTVAIDSAGRRGVPLRLMSLVALGDGPGEDGDARVAAARAHADRLAEKANAALQGRSEVTTVVGHGHSLEDCVQALDFSPGEIVLVGSSRLAGPRRLFIGASASKMLRALPVPMVVVPREYEPPAGSFAP